jgi:prepilin peptidase CpaA
VLDVSFKYGLLAALAIALLIAAGSDLRTRTIGNWLTGAIALGAPFFWWSVGLSLWPGVALQIACAAAVFLVMAVLFAKGGMGGGDVKLIVALALWMPPLVFVVMAFLASLVGGAMSMVAAARNLSPDAMKSPRRALAIAGSALWVAGATYFAWIVGGGRPLQVGAMFEAVVPPSIAAWLAGGLVVVLLLVAGVSSIVTARSQKSRVPVPYGLAISTGALLIIAAQFAPQTQAAGGLG